MKAKEKMTFFGLKKLTFQVNILKKLSLYDFGIARLISRSFDCGFDEAS